MCLVLTVRTVSFKSAGRVFSLWACPSSPCWPRGRQHPARPSAWSDISSRFQNRLLRFASITGPGGLRSYHLSSSFPSTGPRRCAPTVVCSRSSAHPPNGRFFVYTEGGPGSFTATLVRWYRDEARTRAGGLPLRRLLGRSDRGYAGFHQLRLETV
jgi:hypothetical protein